MSSMVTVAAMDRLTIDPHAPEPSYRQLADQLRARIVSGQIQPREALPSLTYIEQETGLAVNTIRKAIALLVEEKLVYAVPGRGTYAAARPPAPGPG
jgi:GntR family transcriptional regulator